MSILLLKLDMKICMSTFIFTVTSLLSIISLFICLCLTDSVLIVYIEYICAIKMFKLRIFRIKQISFLGFFFKIHIRTNFF